MPIKTKKILLIVAIVVSALLILVLIFMIKGSMSKKALLKTSEEYRKITTLNSFAKVEDYKEEKSADDAKENIKKSSGLINQALLARYSILKKDTSQEKNDIAAVEKEVSKGKYEKSLSLTKKSIDTFNKTLDDHNKTTQDELKDISKELIDKYSKGSAIIANQRVVDNWAILTLTSTGGSSFSANAVIKKENGKWIMIMSPRSIFAKKDSSDLEKAGAPKEIVENINVKYTKDILTKIKY